MLRVRSPSGTPLLPKKTSQNIMEINSLLIVNIIAVIIGLSSIYIVYSLRKKIGGRLGGALNLFVWGVVAMTLSFIWSIVSEFIIFAAAFPNEEIQRILMIAGMTIFVLSARKFFTLVQP